jgi:YkoY family integral membrane protein
LELSILLEYGGVLLILIALEGLLAVDNAVVLALMVKHLPEEQRKKALFYGLVGAVLFRLGSLFLISYLVEIWQIQAIGALYLILIAANHLFKKIVRKEHTKGEVKKPKKESGFWMTVFKVELADIAFAIDSILAAVALAVTMTELPVGNIGGLNGGHFAVIFIGGIVGVIIMRFAATTFVKILEKRPGLEIAAYLIVGWVGVKLAVLTLSHKDVGIIPIEFAHSTEWKLIFYGVLILIALGGWFLSGRSSKDNKTVQDAISKQ